MDEEPAKDLAIRAFQKRVLDEFAAVRGEISAIRSEQSAMRSNITEIRKDLVEIRTQQAVMIRNVGSPDQRLTSLEARVDECLKETRPIWEAVQEQLQRLSEKFDILLHEFYEVRVETKIHGRRIGELERRAS